jgi:murein DD-endopeptidase MepM/ murein hydrolase activator NlpD
VTVIPLLAAMLLAAALQPAFAGSEVAVPVAAAAQGGVDAVPEESWRNPLDVIRVNSWYGHVGNVHRSVHKGIDFGAPRGTPVLAAAAGTVAGVARDGKYGIYVLIGHAQRQQSMYAHLDSAVVRIGDVVAPGQVIGKVGTTGKATGPHLHFEVFQDERRVNPQVKLAGLEGLAGMAGARSHVRHRPRYRLRSRRR